MNSSIPNQWHWREYFAEFLGAAFNIFIGLSAIVFNFGHGLPIEQLVPDSSIRRLITGLIICWQFPDCSRFSNRETEWLSHQSFCLTRILDTRQNAPPRFCWLCDWTVSWSDRCGGVSAVHVRRTGCSDWKTLSRF